MKRLWTVSLAVLFAASIAGAEEMRFITTLSSPVGTFAQLETANPEVNTEVPVVNFCNTGVNSGKMTLSGANAYVQKLSLQPGTVLGGDVKEYRLAGTLAVYNAGQVTGGRLIANRVQVFSSTSDAYSQVSDTLYGSGIDLEGAKTTNLTIPGKVQTVNQGDGEELEWSNIYTKDYTCDSKGNCKESGGSYTSYLLKSKGGSVGDCTPPKGQQYTEDCPSGQIGSITYTWNQTDCKYDETSNTCRDGSNHLSPIMDCKLMCAWSYSGGFGIDYTCPSPIPDTGTATSVSSVPSLVQSYYLGLGYKTVPSGCSPGGVCESCTPGQQYIASIYVAQFQATSGLVANVAYNAAITTCYSPSDNASWAAKQCAGMVAGGSL